jgi:hypothetical protein
MIIVLGLFHLTFPAIYTSHLGLLLFVCGLIAFVADWAYADGAIQVIFVLLGLAAAIAGFGVLRAAKTAG